MVDSLNEINAKLDELIAENVAVKEALRLLEKQKQEETQEVKEVLQRVEKQKHEETQEVAAKLARIEAVIARLGIVAIDAVGALVADTENANDPLIQALTGVTGEFPKIAKSRSGKFS